MFNPVVNKQEKVTAIFSALADPTRRRIMERLYGRGETRATALAVPFRISIPAISQRLRPNPPIASAPAGHSRVRAATRRRRTCR